MKSNVVTITKKEFARFFSNRSSAIVSIVLPGLLIFAMWTFMGGAMGKIIQPDESRQPIVAMVNEPASVEPLVLSAGIKVEEKNDVPSFEEVRKLIQKGDIQAFVVFPEDFDEMIATYDSASGAVAPQVEIFYNSTDPDSSHVFTTLSSILDGYESSLANLFDINSAQGSYDVAEKRDIAGTLVVSIVPLILLVLLFSSCMAIAAESVAGEKERGTMATLLSTPINRRDIALGKVIAISLIGLMIAASSTVGIFAGLPSIMQGKVDINVYGLPEYLLLALVIASTTLVVVMLIMVVSTLAKTVKEATMYMTPLMILVMLVGALGMFGGGAQVEVGYYLIPLYNSVQCMVGIFSFDFLPLNVVVCVASNLVCTGVGIVVLQRMFNSERLMFAR